MEGVKSATNVSFARGVVGEAESPGYNMPWDLLHLTLLLPLTWRKALGLSVPQCSHLKQCLLIILTLPCS